MHGLRQDVAALPHECLYKRACKSNHLQALAQSLRHCVHAIFHLLAGRPFAVTFDGSLSVLGGRNSVCSFLTGFSLQPNSLESLLCLFACAPSPQREFLAVYLLPAQNIMKRTFRSFIGASSVISGDFTETAAARPVLA